MHDSSETCMYGWKPIQRFSLALSGLSSHWGQTELIFMARWVWPGIFQAVSFKCNIFRQLLTQKDIWMYCVTLIRSVLVSGQVKLDSSLPLVDLYVYERLSFFGCLISKPPFVYSRHSMLILIIKIIFSFFFLFFSLDLWKFFDYSRLVTYINIQHIYTSRLQKYILFISDF